MADQKDVLRGLEILQAYKPDGESWACDAQHDELYASGPEPEALGGDDAALLADLGWQWAKTFGSWRKIT